MKDQYLFLYHKFLNSTCSESELDLLFTHFGVANEEELKRFILLELHADDADHPATGLEAERLDLVHQRIHAQIDKHKYNVRKFAYRFSAAAAIIMLFTFTIWFFRQPGHPEKVIDPKQTAVITPGRQQATLTLASGKKIMLNTAMNGTLASLGNVSVQINQHKGILYTVKKEHYKTSVYYNTLTTSRGEQSPYPLILADGSKVWLNAASSIIFPTEFRGNERVVRVTGEVYFEVAHNKAMPFKVITEKQEVNVLGTHFNVKSYDDDASISTTLLQGSVKVKDLSSGSSGVLIPGQQAKLNKENRQIAIGTVNTDEIIAWKNGYFIFDNQKITSIMKVMSRWYDVEVEYKNLNNNERFGGTFSRSSNLFDILNSLQSLGKVHFKTDKRKIIVTN